MDNLHATKALCNAIANTFYPDENSINVVLFNAGIDPLAEATPKDKDLFLCAVRLVRGHIETSHSEGGISSATSVEALKQSLNFWSKEYNLTAEDVGIDDLFTVISNGSHLW